MDTETINEAWLESAWADFHDFLQRKEYDQCRALMDTTGENGFETAALKMHHLLNEVAAPMDARDLADRDYPRE